MGCTIGLVNTYSTNIGDAAIYLALTAIASEAKVIAQFPDAQPEKISGWQIAPEISCCDAYISVGGDIFYNARENLNTTAFIGNLVQLTRSSQKTFLFGQSILRSCHSWSFQALTFCLRRLAAVCVRDAESHQRLTKAAVKATLPFDAVFSLTFYEQAKIMTKQVFPALDIPPESTAMISLRAFD